MSVSRFTILPVLLISTWITCQCQPIISGTSNITQISAGKFHLLLLSEEGNVYCVGRNNVGQCGGGDIANLSGESLDSRPKLGTFYRILLPSGRYAIQVAAGSQHSCILMDNNEAICIGDNDEGQLGYGNTENKGTKLEHMGDALKSIDVGNALKVRKIVAGASITCVLLSNDKVKCFGNLGPMSNVLGDGPNEMGNSLPYLDLGENVKAKDVAVGDQHICVLLDNGTVLCNSPNGELIEHHSDLQVMEFDAPVQKLAAKYRVTCVVFLNGSHKCVGETSHDQLNNLDSIPAGSVDQFAIGDRHTCLLLSNHTTLCSGYNRFGQLGVGDTKDREFGEVLVPSKLGGARPIQISAGETFTCVLFQNKRVKCFGRNLHGNLGVGDTTNRGTDLAHLGSNLPYLDAGPGLGVDQIVARFENVFVILQNGGLKSKGANERGELGLGDEKDRDLAFSATEEYLPYVSLGSNVYVKKVAIGSAHTCFLFSNGLIKCTGNNNEGQTGLGRKDDIGDSPDEVGDNLGWVSIGTGLSAEDICAGDEHTCVLVKETGGLKCFGSNSFAELGIGDNKNRGVYTTEMGDNLPYVDFGGLKVLQVQCGYHHTCVILENGDFKCFGRNNAGQLGYFDNENRGDDKAEMGENLPSVEALLNVTIRQYSLGSYHTCVCTIENKILCFGSGFSAPGSDPGIPASSQINQVTELPIGGRSAIMVSAGKNVVCVLFDDGQIRCYGSDFGSTGVDVQLRNGTVATNISTMNAAVCALFSNNRTKCYAFDDLVSPGNRAIPNAPLSEEAKLISHTWEMHWGFQTRCKQGEKFIHSQASCVECPAGTYSASENQDKCVGCSPRFFQNNTGSSSCDMCPPGTFQNQFNSAFCEHCDIGMYENEFGSVRCKRCPTHTTTLERGADQVRHCVAASGYVSIATDKNEAYTLACSEVEGADCSKPGSTVSNLPLQRGYWRANNFTIHQIQKCPGGSSSCQGGDVGEWNLEKYSMSTKYCAHGYHGPHCEICDDGFADVKNNGICVECQSSDVSQFQSLGASIPIAVASTLLMVGITVCCSCCLDSEDWNEITKKLLSVVFLSFTTWISFLQILSSYGAEFKQYDWNFRLEFSQLTQLWEVCSAEESFRTGLMMDGIVPILLAFISFITYAGITCLRGDVAENNTAKCPKFEDYKFAIAALPLFLALPGVERKVLSVVDCKTFQLTEDGKNVSLLSRDLRLDCESEEYVDVSNIAAVFGVLYPFLLLVVFYRGMEYNCEKMEKWFLRPLRASGATRGSNTFLVFCEIKLGEWVSAPDTNDLDDTSKSNETSVAISIVDSPEKGAQRKNSATLVIPGEVANPAAPAEDGSGNPATLVIPGEVENSAAPAEDGSGNPAAPAEDRSGNPATSGQDYLTNYIKRPPSEQDDQSDILTTPEEDEQRDNPITPKKKSQSKPKLQPLWFFFVYDIVRKILQASLIVFFGSGQTQIMMSAFISFVACCVAITIVPYRLIEVNVLYIWHLASLVAICFILGSVDDTTLPLDSTRQTLLTAIVAIFGILTLVLIVLQIPLWLKTCANGKATSEKATDATTNRGRVVRHLKQENGTSNLVQNRLSNDPNPKLRVDSEYSDSML